MRDLLLRGAAATITLGAILAAILWPNSSTCVANCAASQSFFDQPPVFAVDQHIGLRILVAAGGLALGAVVAALTFPKSKSKQED